MSSAAEVSLKDLSGPHGGAQRLGIVAGAARAVRGVGVLLLFGPHLAVIMALGPRLGLRWAHLVGYLHYLITYLGAQRQTLRTLRRVAPMLDTACPPREILKRHLILKHHSFAEWRLCTTRRGLAYLRSAYDVLREEDLAELRRRHEDPRGLLVVGYHFGMYKLLASSLAVIYKVKITTANFISAHYRASTLGPIARIAFNNAIKTAGRAPAEGVCLKPDGRPTVLFKALRKGEIIGIAADGMVSSDLCDAPFLGGVLRLPEGWARLAAMSGSPCMFMFCSLHGVHGRSIVASPAIEVDNTPESIRAAVCQGAALLEEQVRARPWEWHIWHRIQFEQTPAGRPAYRIAPPHLKTDEVYSGELRR